jgi:hypothetical protein
MNRKAGGGGRNSILEKQKKKEKEVQERILRKQKDQAALIRNVDGGGGVRSSSNSILAASTNKLGALQQQQQHQQRFASGRNNITNNNNNSSSNNNSRDTEANPSQWAKYAQETAGAVSAFDVEAKREQFGRSRAALDELEVKENIAEKRSGSSSSQQENAKAIHKSYVCVTCNNRSFRDKPKSCILSGHEVKTKRNVLPKSGASNQSSSGNWRKENSDGLVLGSGIHWDAAYAIND